MRKWFRRSFLALAILGLAISHPLGNFTINHFSGLKIARQQINVTYIVDMAEIPAFGELRAADTNGDGKTSQAELNAYVARNADSYINGLRLTVDGTREGLTLQSQHIATLPGAGGLPTLRLEYDLAATNPEATLAQPHELRFDDTNQRDRIGWREIVVSPGSHITVFNSSAFSNSISDELRTYPQDMLASPLNEHTATLHWSSELAPSGARLLRTRNGAPLKSTPDRFAQLIQVGHLTPAIALLGLLIAASFGAAHALSPGHGKTIVGAYLVGSRGTPRHALFLGLTVTVTHTAGVFALGLCTLFASRYIVPERLFPVLSFASGALVVLIGFSLFTRRLAGALSGIETHSHDDDPTEEMHAHGAHVHSHGGKAHSHLPPGAAGDAITWRNLLALGISGGLLPCPSALVVLLSAVALHRVGYGLVLVFAFSVGLASTLTSIGLAFVYAGRWLNRFGSSPRMSAAFRVVPVLSAFVVGCVGIGICYEAIWQTGFDPVVVLHGSLVNWRAVLSGQQSLSSMGAFAVLTFGLILGFKHATEADHVIAVSSIVSEHRKLTKVALVGGLWGVGHTLTLVLVGLVVLLLRVAIPDRISQFLEFGVGLMIIGLSCAALNRARRNRDDLHLHTHSHGHVSHSHLHFHEQASEHSGFVQQHSHTVSRIGLKPLLVGAMHGLAGSAALTLLVLTQVHNTLLGISYLLLFGLGSVFGMMAVSTLIGVPFAFSSSKLTNIALRLQVTAGVIGVCFGCWYAYSVGVVAFRM